MRAMLRLSLAGMCAVGAFRAALDAAGFVLAPLPGACRRQVTRVTRSAADKPAPADLQGMLEKAKELQQQMPDLEALDAVLKDPEKAKTLQDKAAEMMKDPEAKMAMGVWQKTVFAVMKKLQDDPEMKDVLADIQENGIGAWEKFKDNEHVQQKIAAVQQELKEELVAENASHEQQEEMVKQIFAKFDEDKDDVLSLTEFNALQLSTEGPDCVYEQKELESLVLAVNPEVKEPSRGMPFADYRRLYMDLELKSIYKTDIVGDHKRLFPAA